jgi:hypothetical protein
MAAKAAHGAGLEPAKEVAGIWPSRCINGRQKAGFRSGHPVVYWVPTFDEALCHKTSCEFEGINSHSRLLAGYFWHVSKDLLMQHRVARRSILFCFFSALHQLGFSENFTNLFCTVVFY